MSHTTSTNAYVGIAALSEASAVLLKNLRESAISGERLDKISNGAMGGLETYVQQQFVDDSNLKRAIFAARTVASNLNPWEKASFYQSFLEDLHRAATAAVCGGPFGLMIPCNHSKAA